MGERRVRNAEARGSNPLISTQINKASLGLALFICRAMEQFGLIGNLFTKTHTSTHL